MWSGCWFCGRSTTGTTAPTNRTRTQCYFLGIPAFCFCCRLLDFALTRLSKKKRLDSQQNRTVKTLDKLGKQKLETQKSFQRFADAFEKIKNRPEFRTGREEHYVFARHELQSLREISLSAVETIAGIGASVTAGTATAAGAYALVGVLGTASTGTAISGLAGAAASARRATPIVTAVVLRTGSAGRGCVVTIGNVPCRRHIGSR